MLNASAVFLKNRKKKMNQKRIYQLIEKATLNDKEKAEIRKEAQRLGINVSFRQGCRSCYETALLRIYEATAKMTNVSKDGYRFKRLTDSFRIGGTVVNNESIKGMNVGMFHRHIIDTFFEKSETVETKKQKEAEPENLDTDGTEGSL